MINTNLFIVCIAVVCILQIIVVLKLFMSNKIIINDSEYLVLIKHLQIIINDYHKTILIPKIEEMHSQYDLDPNSQVNAIKSFKDKITKLERDAAKKILNEFISNDCKKILKKYFNTSSLSLFVLSTLKEE